MKNSSDMCVIVSIFAIEIFYFGEPVSPLKRLRDLPAISLPLAHSRPRFRRRPGPSRCQSRSATLRQTCMCKSRTGTAWFWMQSVLRRCRRRWRICGMPPQGTCTCGQIIIFTLIFFNIFLYHIAIRSFVSRERINTAILTLLKIYRAIT